MGEKDTSSVERRELRDKYSSKLSEAPRAAIYILIQLEP